MAHNNFSLAEKAFFFPGSRKRNLFGFLHTIDSASCSTGIVYCHPFAEEKNMSHSVAVKAARLFTLAGFPVFRFDFSGCGDSEGDLQSVSVDDWQQDLSCAIEVFRQETGVTKCLLWGLRLGAGLALLREQDTRGIGGLILWQPVLDFSVHIRQFLRRAISSQIVKGQERNGSGNFEGALQHGGLTHVIGYPVTSRFCDDFENTGNDPENVVPSVPALIMSISAMEQSAHALKRYAQRLDEAGAQVVLKHVVAEPFWDRYWQWECKKPAVATLQWLQDTMS